MDWVLINETVINLLLKYDLSKFFSYFSDYAPGLAVVHFFSQQNFDERHHYGDKEREPVEKI